MSSSTEDKHVHIGERIFYLNNTKTKYVIVSLFYNSNNFIPCVRISENIKNYINFNENDWNSFLSQKEIINKFMNLDEEQEAIVLQHFCLEFESLEKVIKILNKHSTVWLDFNSISQLWKMLPLINHILYTYKRQQFDSALKVIELGVQHSSDVTNTALKIIEPIKTVNPITYALGVEIIYMYPEFLENKNEESYL